VVVVAAAGVVVVAAGVVVAVKFESGATIFKNRFVNKLNSN